MGLEWVDMILSDLYKRLPAESQNGTNCATRSFIGISYINSTIDLDLHLFGWVGDRSDMIEVVTYCDADLAGDRTDAKSTSGVLVCLVGPRTYMPITAVSKKQTSVSKSPPEAGISKEAMMLAALWHFAIGHGSSDSIVCKCKIKYDASIPQPISVLEDNEAACRIIVTGNNPNMRHMSRTQRVDIAWLNERYNDKIFRFVACPSDYQGADILTKACVDKIVWSKNLHMLGMFKQGFMQSYLSHPTQPVHVPPAAPALPPIRGVRIESDHDSKFNAFINDAIITACRASIDEVRASENDSLTIVVDSSVLPLLPPQRGHRVVQLDIDDGNAGGIATYPGIKGKRANFAVFNIFPSCPDSCKRDWSKIRKFRQKCDALTASTLAFALNALHHDFGIVLGYGGDLPGLI